MNPKSGGTSVNDDPRAVFVGRHSANVIDVFFALRDSGLRPVDGVTWLYDRLGEEASQAIVDGNHLETLRQAAGVALFHAPRAVWVLSATDPPEALAQAAADLLSASSTGRPASLFVIESSESGPLLRSLAELAQYWQGVRVEVVSQAELPARVVVQCSAGGGA